jgi:hypothetical protein
VQRAIEIKMDSRGVSIQDLGIDGGGVGLEGDGGAGSRICFVDFETSHALSNDFQMTGWRTF